MTFFGKKHEFLASNSYLDQLCGDHNENTNCTNDVRCEWNTEDNSCEVSETMQDWSFCPNVTRPLPPRGKFKATYSVTLTGFTKAQFGAKQRRAFKRGVAIYLKIMDAQVTITDVLDVSSNKRRISKSATSKVQVEYSIDGSMDDVKNYKSDLNSAKAASQLDTAFKFAFESNELTVPSSLTVSTATTSVDSPPPSVSPPPYFFTISYASTLGQGASFFVLFLVALASGFLVAA